MYYNPRAADVNQGENLLSAKEGFAALNRRMLPAGRLLVSCRTSGSLNRPLAALTSGALDPSEESRFAPSAPRREGRAAWAARTAAPRSVPACPLRAGTGNPMRLSLGEREGAFLSPERKAPSQKKEKNYFVSLSYAFLTPHFQHSSIPATAPTAACRIWYGSLRMAYSGVL